MEWLNALTELWGCMLTMYAEKKQNQWDEYLPYVMMAYRSSVHDSTGFSLNMLMLGREVELPLHTVVPRPEGTRDEDLSEYVEHLQDALQDAHEVTREHLQRSAQYQKRNYDHRSATAKKYTIGQAVWYYNTQRKKGVCSKLTSPWRGPYTVVQCINDVTYRIQRNMRSDAFVCHVDNLKSYEGPCAPKWYRP